MSDTTIEPTYRIYAAVQLEPDVRPRPGERLHVHHGTREAPARAVGLDDGLVQLRLEAPLMPVRGDRLVLRRLDPPDTIGGGVVLAPRPRRHGADAAPVERLRAIERGEDPPDPQAERAAPQVAVAEPPPPEPAALDPVALQLAAMLRADGERPRADGDLASAVGIQPVEATKQLNALTKAGLAARVAPNLHCEPVALETLVARILAICEREGSVTIGGVRDELGTTRRYAQALLEYLDSQRLTRRQGDTHVLRRPRRA